MDPIKAAAFLIGRLFIAGVFIWDATVMIRLWEPTVAYMESFGLPGALLPPAALFQFVGGIAVVIGVLTRPAALAFAGYCVLTAVIFHRDFADIGELTQFGKDFGLAGGFLFLFAAGPGAWSFDGRRGRG